MFGIYESDVMIAKFAAPLTLNSNVPIIVSDTLSLKRTVYKSSAQRWELTAEVMPLTFGAEDLFTMLVTKGSTETFKISVPQNYGVILRTRSNGGVPTASGTLGTSTLSVDGNTGNLIPKGTMIKLAGHDKIYMTTSELNEDDDITIFPKLRATITSQILYFKEDVFMNAYLDTDSVKGMIYSDGIMMTPGQLKFVEKL